MKRFSMLLVALAFVSASAFAQTYKTKLSAAPTIVDLFLEAAKHDECGADYMEFILEAVKGKKLSYTKCVIDKKNGYLKVEKGSEEDGKEVQSCFWKMNNGKLLLAIAHVAQQEEYALHFFEYDKATRTLKAITRPFDFGLGDKESDMRYELPRYGKSIKAETYDFSTSKGEPYRWTITWNGSSFVVKRSN